MNQIRVTDADIVAFLDDALPSDQQARIAVASLEDPLVAERIEALSLERDRLTGAFDNLLKAAPVIEIEPALETEISEAPTVNTSAREAANDPKPPAWRWRVVAAAALLSVGIGVGTQIPEGSHDKWHMAVADYQVLYATETLTSMELTQSQRWNSLGQTSEALGLPLDRKDVTL